ncbi:MAG: gliding motility-associated lipoprotein [Flavipsychrobacter sp.]|nr:gliding motility-associated lipoprotein [Flavipsychrobacter sp.]
MPLNKAFITIILFFTTFLLSTDCFSQGKDISRTRYVIPYPHKIVAPPGMTYVQGGVTTINYDQSTTDTNSARKVSLTSFFMDKTEVTNQQYRQFVNWVADSIAIVNYLKDDSYFMSDEESNKMNSGSSSSSATTTTPMSDSAVRVSDSLKMAGIMTPDATASVPQNDSARTGRRINWAKVNHNKIFNHKDPDMVSKLGAIMDENGNIKKDACLFSYKHPKHTAQSTKGNQKLAIVTETLNIYPNENVWNQDLTNAQTDMYVENYFSAPPFDDYPVVGVTWQQAVAFAQWRTNNAQSYYNMPDYMKYYKLIYTLPSEAQWVYAAQGFYDMIRSKPPVEGPDTMNITLPNYVDSTVTAKTDSMVDAILHKSPEDSAKEVQDQIAAIKADRVAEWEKEHKKAENGNRYLMDYIKMLNFLQNGYGANGEGPITDSTPIHRDYNGMLANFKQDEGDYWEDGVALTTPAMSFAPNEFGLYNMEGNVAEWVMDAYSPSAFSFVSDINPQLLYDADSTDADVMKRKVVRGGSFISNAKSLSPYYRDMELHHVSHCFLGFRCVMQAPELVTPNNATRNRTNRGKKTPGKLSGARLPEIR